MRERRLDAVRRIVRQRQRDRAGRRDRAVVREARADFGELIDQLRRHLGDALHVAAVLRVQDAARDLLTDPPAVARHLRTLAQHLGGDFELLEHDRRRTFLARQLERRFPAGDRHLARDVLREGDGLASSRTSCTSIVIAEPRPRKPMP